MSLSNALQVLGIDPKWEEPLQAAFTKYDINTSKRQAAFLGQCAHESGNFKTPAPAPLHTTFFTGHPKLISNKSG